MKRLPGISLAIATSLLVAGCTNADNARRTIGDCTVTLYGLDGKPIKSWETDGRPKSEANSDGWYFLDKGTRHAVIVSGGALVIESKE